MSNDMDDFDLLLQEFIDSELKDFEESSALEEAIETSVSTPALAPTTILEEDIQNEEEVNEAPQIKIMPKKMPALNPELAPEEKNLVKAWLSYTSATYAMAESYQKTTLPIFATKQEDLLPRYKPNIVETITRDTLLGWVIMLETYPNQVSSIHPNSSDEQILTLAEDTSDAMLQDALISYIEILIELEACDIAYQTRLINAKKKNLSKKLYDEHNERREKIQKYIKALENKKFPVDAHNLIINYFKVASRDPEAAWETLTTNPAVFSPIQLDKIPATWWGFKKPKPEDGFKWNKKIGEFLKKLKVK
ncbi:MAG: hypothetical protein R3Y43_04485 [Alphaproteobacteria bacterium]